MVHTTQMSPAVAIAAPVRHPTQMRTRSANETEPDARRGEERRVTDDSVGDEPPGDDSQCTITQLVCPARLAARADTGRRAILRFASPGVQSMQEARRLAYLYGCPIPLRRTALEPPSCKASLSRYENNASLVRPRNTTRGVSERRGTARWQRGGRARWPTRCANRRELAAATGVPKPPRKGPCRADRGLQGRGTRCLRVARRMHTTPARRR